LSMHGSQRNRTVQIMKSRDVAVRGPSRKDLNTAVHVYEKQVAIHADAIKPRPAQIGDKYGVAADVHIVLPTGKVYLPLFPSRASEVESPSWFSQVITQEHASKEWILHNGSVLQPPIRRLRFPGVASGVQ